MKRARRASSGRRRRRSGKSHTGTDSGTTVATLEEMGIESLGVRTRWRWTDHVRGRLILKWRPSTTRSDSRSATGVGKRVILPTSA